jgi:hypothetical protein
MQGRCILVDNRVLLLLRRQQDLARQLLRLQP